MKGLWITLAVMFIVVTLGIVDVEMSLQMGQNSHIKVGYTCLIDDKIMILNGD